MVPSLPRLFAICVALLAGCAHQPSPAATGPSELAVAESLYADLRDVRDRIDVTLGAGLNGILDSTPVAAWITAHNRLRQAVSGRLDAIDSAGLRDEDWRALSQMRRTLRSNLDSLTPPHADSSAGTPHRPSCAYDPRAVAASRRGVDSLRAPIYSSYGWAQAHVILDGDTLDRLTIL